MKESSHDFNKVFSSHEEMFDAILAFLVEAERAAKWVFWRERFACTHPDWNKEEIADPNRWAEVNWRMAKYVYCSHKEILDKHYELTNSIGANSDKMALFNAMRKVIEEEMSEQLEQQVLKEESVKNKNHEDLEFDVEVDEDEQYVSETEGHDLEEEELEWDGDDYLGSSEDEELYD